LIDKVNAMTTNTAALIAKIGNALFASGMPRESAARIACSVVIDELTKVGVDIKAATEMVYGVNFWESVLDTAEVAA
jgi:hypothetical protein